MQAIILAGGKGTRLAGLHPDLPKVLVPVAGRPLLAWMIDWLRAGGVSAAHVAAGHLAEPVRTWAREHTAPDFPVTVSVEPKPLGTGGGLRHAAGFTSADPILALNGDSLLPRLDFGAMDKAFHRSRAQAMLAVTRIMSADRYGTVEFDARGRVTAFREKAVREAGWINGGVYLVRRKALAAVPADLAISIETDLFPRWAEAGRLFAFEVEPPLLDMGTPDGLRDMETFLADKPVYDSG